MNINYKYNNIKNDDDIDVIIKEMRNKIVFPFKKEYIKHDIKTLFNNLRQYDSKLTEVQRYSIHNIGYFKTKSIDSTFRNRYYQFINDDDVHYEQINILSDYFSEVCRIYSKRYDGSSPFDNYNNDRVMFDIIKDLVKNKQDINWINIRENLYAKGECSNFKLTLALSIYKFFGASRILDISAGWGDRLIAAIAYEDVIEYYHGFDPSECMKAQYKYIIDALAKDKKKFIVKTIGFEDAKLNNKYNLICTSPPFFNLEVYSEESSQSISKYSNKIEWFCNMLINWLITAWKALDMNGHMVINIEDIIKKHGEFKQITLYTEAMILFVSGFFKHACYEGVIGHTSVGRNVVRPLWVWKKINSNESNYKENKKKYRQEFRKHYPDEYNCLENKLSKHDT